MDERPVEMLAKGSFPELAAVLRRRAPDCLAQWEQLVRQHLPCADRLTFEQLRDDIPKVLDMFSASLATVYSGRTGELIDAAPHHGEVRFHQSFSLQEMLIEYDMLRAVVMEQVLIHLGRAIKPDEAVALGAALGLAGRRAVMEYVKHKEEELRAATEAQSKYLSFLSHDLRGGLNGVFLMIEVLRRELAQEPRLSETLTDLDTMRRSLLDTVSTMDRFLHAERFRKGKVQPRPGRVHLKPLLQECVSHFSYQAKDKGLELQLDIATDCSVTSDRELLTLILQNLLSNAVKYTKRGKIQVSAHATDKEGCLLSVRDDGPGIAPDLLESLFGAFTRGQTHGQPGVGLGLSIAWQAAKAIGAELWAESEVGQGSVFYVRLPKDLPAST